MIAFDVPVSAGELDEIRWMQAERHSCGSLYVGACRGCAQARVQHDSGDEESGQWDGAKGLWLIGGGRYDHGQSGGCSVTGLLTDGRPIGSDRWDNTEDGRA